MPPFHRRSPQAIPHATLTTAALVLGVVLGPLALPACADGWRWPLDGRPAVVRGFDPPSERWAAGHRGVDLRGQVGETVRAAGPGVVGYAGLLAGRGVVTVHHDGGLETTYEPLRVAVTAGTRVEAGDVLGRLSGGHGDCGVGSACLHWGLRRGPSQDPAYLDPLGLVGAGPVRLLPLDDNRDPRVAPLPQRPPQALVEPTHRPAAVHDPHQPAGRRDVDTAGGVVAVSALAAAAVAGGLTRRRRGAAR